MTDRRRTSQLWHRLDVTVRDLPLGVLLLVASVLPAFRGNGTEIGGLATRGDDALTVVAAVLQCLPLVVRRRWPPVCLALVSLGFALDHLRGYHLIAGTALPIALLSAGSHLERFRRTVPAVATVVYAVLAVALDRSGPGQPVAELVTFYLALGLAWGIGAWMRSARAAEAERRERVAEEARAVERGRDARELHDVVTHHVTAMVVQSEAARYLTAAPERLDETLATPAAGPSPTCATCSTPTTARPSRGRRRSAAC